MIDGNSGKNELLRKKWGKKVEKKKRNAKCFNWEFKGNTMKCHSHPFESDKIQYVHMNSPQISMFAARLFHSQEVSARTHSRVHTLAHTCACVRWNIHRSIFSMPHTHKNAHSPDPSAQFSSYTVVVCLLLPLLFHFILSSSAGVQQQ